MFAPTFVLAAEGLASGAFALQAVQWRVKAVNVQQAAICWGARLIRVCRHSTVGGHGGMTLGDGLLAKW